MALKDDILALPSTVGEGSGGHLGNHATLHAGLKDHETRITNAESNKADKTTLDARVPSNMALRLDTTVGTRIFAGDTMIFSDTGMRALVTWDANGVVTHGELPPGIIPRSGNIGGIYIRRKLSLVTMYVVAAEVSAVNPTIPVPAGFRSGFPYPSVPVSSSHSKTVYATSGSSTVTFYGAAVGDLLATASQYFGSVISWEAGTAWPTTLPGLPA